MLRLRKPFGRPFIGRELLASASIAAASIAATAAFAACSGSQNSQAPAESASTPETAPEGDSTEHATPVAAPHGKRAPCSTDQSCNDDPSVSALWGRCTEMGVCECNEGFERSPTSDLCRPVGVE
ncbi:MAG TPA: hypothetical protein VMG12_09710 [Polyangiaceae bacterium]|nr:hypothetical protein [Polyangiaceae bacterium]